MNEIEKLTKGIWQRKHHFNYEIYTACMYFYVRYLQRSKMFKHACLFASKTCGLIALQSPSFFSADRMTRF